MRHGEVAYFADPANPVAHDDAVLTPAGFEQARAAGRTLAEVRFDRVVTSGLQRTIQTAQLVVEQLRRAPARSELESWPELQEMRGGDLDAVPDDDLEDGFLAVSRGVPPHTATYVGGETVGALVARVGSALDRLLADESWDTVLLVLHGFVNRAVLGWALDGHDRFFGQLEQSPACINIIDAGQRPFVIRAINMTPYDLVQSSTRETTLEQYLKEYQAYRKAMQR
jgi:probable phosphoglycerate mutase